MPQYSWPIGVGRVDRLRAAVRPEIGAADAGRREPDDRVGRLRGSSGRRRSRSGRRADRRGPLLFMLVSSFIASAYCSSVTCSIHSTALPSSASWMAMCVIAVVGDAPCQCFSPGANQTTSPGRISSIGPPSRCTRPRPAVTISVWPSGCVCHAVRAPGSKVTAAPADARGCRRVEQRIDAHGAGEPVGRSLAEGCVPARLMSMIFPSAATRPRVA